MMLYVPYYGGLLCRPYPDLDDAGGLLSRAFGFLNDGKDDDARLIWMEEILSIDTSASYNLWGSTDRLFGRLRIAGYRDYTRCHPLENTIVYRCQQILTCIAQGGCSGNDTALHSDSEDEEVKITGVNTVSKIATGQTVPLLVDDQGMPCPITDSLKLKLGDVHVPKCSHKMCKGPFLQKAKVISWPHVVVFDCCVTAMLEDMPFTFMWNHKKFVLRCALLGNNSHFIALICTPEAWLHYDGLKDIKFCFYNLQDTATARGEYGLDKVLYEVLDEDDTRDFGSTNIHWKIF